LNLKGEIVFFADDCSLILTGDTYQEVEECANHDLQLIEKWLKANRLILNVKKSNYLIINLNHRSINDLNIVICNERLIRVTKVKILGVFFDDRFVFDEHINSLSKKMNQRIGLLSRLRHFLPEKTLVIVYNSIVLPILDYSLVLWGYTYSNHINRLITLQKRAIRVMTFSRFDAHSEPLFEKLDIMPLKKRLLFNSSIYIYKALNSLCSLNSIKFFSFKTQRSSCRSANKLELFVPFTRLTVFQNTIFVKGVKIYNSIDLKIRSVDKLSKFISYLKLSLNGIFNSCESLF
jgi:hypothetical protein